MNDVASALDAAERQEAIQAAERREANQALAEKRARQHQEETEQAHKQQKLLHKCIWDNMRPSDRAELLSVKEGGEHSGSKTRQVGSSPSCSPEQPRNSTEHFSGVCIFQEALQIAMFEFWRKNRQIWR
jgi:hypothetical protein